MTERLYMLRVWQDEENKEWHASLKNIETKEVQYFERLEGVTRFLEQEVISKERGGTP
jgi:hypothetical protein